MSDPRIIVALDYDDADRALAVAGQLSPELCRVKVGMELFTAAGPSVVERLMQMGHQVFLDLKFHDIPTTAAGACAAAAGLGVWMMNVHALGGPRMLAAAREAVPPGPGAPRLIGVTILTSHDRAELEGIGIAGDPAEAARRLAEAAAAAGLDGVVCSAREAGALRKRFGPGFLLVTPGIRPAGAGAGDQRRIMTPEAALDAGSDYLVIGRPITQAPSPGASLEAISKAIQGLDS